MPSDFYSSLKIGQAYEGLLNRYFTSKGASVIPATIEEQFQGIDAIVDGDPFEYKTDFRADETGNCFIEMISNDVTGRQGWLYTSQATWLCIYLPQSDRLFFLRFPVLRSTLQSEWNYPVKRTRPDQNCGYNSWGMIVPIEEIKKISAIAIEGIDE